MSRFLRATEIGEAREPISQEPGIVRDYSIAQILTAPSLGQE